MTKQRTPATTSGSGSSNAGRERETAAMRERRGGDKSANQDELPLGPPPPSAARHLRLPERRTAMERLMTEMRVDACAHADVQHASEDNQQVADDYADVSLELLALLSPHGTTQQREEEDEYNGYIDTKYGEAEQHAKRLSMLARVDLAEYSGGHSKSTRYEPPDLTSPTQHTVPFRASPTHSAHGNEMDLASPVALPDSPQNQQMPWQSDEFALSDDTGVLSGAHDTAKDPAGTAQDAPRSSPSTVARRGASPSTRRSPQPPHGPGRTPMKPTPAVSETKPKARHGGIYSLLLKNKAPEHEPVLVDEKRSPLGPEVSPSLSSISKRTSPQSFAKIQHGGIYGLLRRNSKGGE